MFDLFGSGMPLAARFFIAFLVVLALIGVTAWLVRRFGSTRLGGANARGRQPRLAVIDAASVDGRRRLVLIRRDNIEHLLMIGGPTDVVIEPNIVRAAPAREPARPESSTRAAPSSAETAWPLQPTYEPPPLAPTAPVAPPRGQRATLTEEPWLPGEPGGRPRPVDNLATFTAETPNRFASPEPPAFARQELRQEPRPEPRHEVRQEARYEPPAPPPEPQHAMQNDRNLADMAMQLEAALRRAPTPEIHPPVTDPFAVPPPAPETPRPAARDFKRAEPRFDAQPEPKAESKPELTVAPTLELRPEPAPKAASAPAARVEPKLEAKPEATPETKADVKPVAKVEPKKETKPELATAGSKTFYDSLEEEMASLLGRPSGKS